MTHAEATQPIGELAPAGHVAASRQSVASPPGRVRTRAAALDMASSGIPGPGELNVSVNRPSRRMRADRARPPLGSAPV